MAPPKLSVAEYDKLSPEEQKAYDGKRAETEAAEQAGKWNSRTFGPLAMSDNVLPVALPYRWCSDFSAA
jgi:hypothetical protein